MFNYLQLFPPYLILLTIIMVVIPAIAAMSVRIAVYKHLIHLLTKAKRLVKEYQSPGQKPRLVENLEKRYRKASQNLERVNTAALIDECYSEEKLKLWGWELPCEQWDYFSRLLPNLLLTFGLLGTFFGITLNLYNLSQTVNAYSESQNVDIFVQGLEGPLQSMGIAFITSLIALIFSSLLTLINLRCNTSIAKFSLISTLEDYLDNNYQITVEGHSRLDKAVDRMTRQQEQFLTRFHEKVGQVIENSLGRAANRLVDENAEAKRLAEQVYTRFLESSGTLASGASTFQQAMGDLKSEIAKIQQIMSAVDPFLEKFIHSVEIWDTAAKRIEASKFSQNLENLTAKLAVTQTEFAQATVGLESNLHSITNNYQEAAQLAKLVYQQFSQSSQTLKTSSETFVTAATTIAESKFTDKLAEATTDLTNAQDQFSQSIATLDNTSVAMQKSLVTVDDSVEKMVQLGEQMHQVHTVSQNLLNLNEKRLEKEEKAFRLTQENLNNLVHKMTELSEEMKQFQTLSQNLLNLNEKRLEREEKASNTTQDNLNNLVHKIIELSEEMKQFQTLSQKMINLNEKRLEKEEKVSDFSQESLGDLADNMISYVSTSNNNHGNNSSST